MGNIINVSNAPKKLRPYLARGDKDYNGKLDNKSEVKAALTTACAKGKKG